MELRAGLTLRVYSQEMVLAALATGRDPLEEADEEVLAAFLDGHPALEFLSSLEFPWPYMAAVDTSEVIEPDPSWDRVQESPLKLMGYPVRANNDLDEFDRQEILEDAFKTAELPWVESDQYTESWGRGGSHQRLWRIALHIPGLIGTLGRKPDNKAAHERWEENLEWMYEELYLPRKYKHQWPEVSVV